MPTYRHHLVRIECTPYSVWIRYFTTPNRATQISSSADVPMILKCRRYCTTLGRASGSRLMISPSLTSRPGPSLEMHNVLAQYATSIARPFFLCSSLVQLINIWRWTYMKVQHSDQIWQRTSLQHCEIAILETVLNDHTEPWETDDCGGEQNQAANHRGSSKRLRHARWKARLLFFMGMADLDAAAVTRLRRDGVKRVY
ncbi:hypothetical protein K440DRAFT_139584 [Wilcoxina mikolae CBS 423.85]|nr:hypothetical protein K440DRAFT_139584 [Wilcoxina mikolae CBS 423.85]